MNSTEMDELVERHFGFEACDDVDGVVATMTSDARHQVIGSPLGEIQGTADLRRFYTELFASLTGEHVEPMARHHGDDLIIDDSIWTGMVHDGRLLGAGARSGRATFRLLHVFQLRDHLISNEQVWVDTAAVISQLT